MLVVIALRHVFPEVADRDATVVVDFPYRLEERVMSAMPIENSPIISHGFLDYMFSGPGFIVVRRLPNFLRHLLGLYCLELWFHGRLWTHGVLVP